MAGFFDDPVDPAEIENEYIDQQVPREAFDLWERSIAESDAWDSMTPEQHMQAADLFGEAVVGGSLSTAEDFLDMLDIEWDNDDIRDFWDAYDAVAH